MNTREPLYISLSGTPRERGLAYGKAASALIVQNIALYKRLLRKFEDAALRIQAQRFADITAKFRPTFVEEMDAIAEGAGVEREYIYMLNARTELLGMEGVVQSECATFFFADTGLLCENWDWVEPSKDLSVLLSIELEGGRKILVFTEAGMLGKVGMSSAGFGVAFNYLYPSVVREGIPVHVLLRALLESASYEDAVALIQSSEFEGTSGNILLGGAHGQGVDFELSGAGVSTIPLSGSTLAHTNHFVAGNENDPEAGPNFLHNSFERYERAQQILGEISAHDIQSAQKLLLDRKAGEGMICRDFIAEEPSDTMGTGTIASMVMDLRAGAMHIALDPQSPDSAFTMHSL